MSGIKRDVSARMSEQQKQLTQLSDKLSNVERQLVAMQSGGSLGFYMLSDGTRNYEVVHKLYL